MKKKNILLITDFSSYGNVALTIMIPTLNALSIETHSLPTALVSNTLDYGKFEIFDTTQFMCNTMKVWDLLSFKFDVICTGFIVSPMQADLIYNYCKKQNGSKIFVDPILGDEHKLYNGITTENIIFQKKLCSIADVIVPNITEACFLSDSSQKETYTKNEIINILDKLKKLGPNHIIITSVDIEGKKFNVLMEHKKNVTFIPYNEITVHFPGTGDLFMSILLGYYAKNHSLYDCVYRATKLMTKIIKICENQDNKNNGIPIEMLREDFINEKA